MAMLLVALICWWGLCYVAAGFVVYFVGTWVMQADAWVHTNSTTRMMFLLFTAILGTIFANIASSFIPE